MILPDNVWRLFGGRALGPTPFLVAGIVNATPDSFYDGGERERPEDAVRCGLDMAAQGAHVIDVGGESSRPYADPVAPEEELRRVLPVVRGLAEASAAGDGADGERPVVSVDTYNAGCAAKVLEAGAAVINDISAFSFDPGLLDVLASFRPGYVLMHSLGRPETMQDAPRYDDVVDEVRAFFEQKLSALVKAGLPEDHVVLDPGVGFGKRLEHNLALLRGLSSFAALGRPVMVGLSNKSLFGDLLGRGLAERGPATTAATALAASLGAWAHRVHDVPAALDALRLARALRVA